MPLTPIDPEYLSEQLLYAGTSPVLAIDTEGNAKDVRKNADPRGRTMGVSLGYRPRIGGHSGVPNGVQSAYWPFFHKGSNLPESTLQRMRMLIESFEGPIIMHNAKHDIAALANLGIEVPRSRIFDTILGVTWINEELLNKGLDSASKHYGGEPKNRSAEMQLIIDKLGWEYVPAEMMYEYAANDAKITLELYESIYPTFEAEGYSGYLWERELEFMDLIMRMESLGVGVEQNVCEEQSFIGEIKIQEVKELLGGRNPMSRNDLEAMLIHEMGLPVFEYTDAGKPSFNKNAMKEYEAILENRKDPTAQLVLEGRGWQKTVSSNYRAYLELLSPDGNLRASYKLHGTRTGRISCEKPNLQQIPRSSEKPWNGKLKKAFKATPGYTLYEADYSQLEMRLATVYSRDPVLMEVFNSGVDLFDDMAEKMPHWERHDLKTNTYATLYGAGARKIALILNTSPETAFAMRDAFYGTYRGLRQMQSRAGSVARRKGYVKVWTGRRRHFNDPQKGSHKAFNSIIQGGGAEIVKSAMLALDKLIDWVDCRMLLQIHDSVVFEIANGAEAKWLPIIKKTMEDVGQFLTEFKVVPFPVDIHRFGEKQRIHVPGVMT